jgi:hypothetical protein
MFCSCLFVGGVWSQYYCLIRDASGGVSLAPDSTTWTSTTKCGPITNQPVNKSKQYRHINQYTYKAIQKKHTEK